jgi:hypothetical protein
LIFDSVPFSASIRYNNSDYLNALLADVAPSHVRAAYQPRFQMKGNRLNEIIAEALKIVEELDDQLE